MSPSSTETTFSQNRETQGWRQPAKPAAEAITQRDFHFIQAHIGSIDLLLSYVMSLVGVLFMLLNAPQVKMLGGILSSSGPGPGQVKVRKDES